MYVPIQWIIFMAFIYIPGTIVSATIDGINYTLGPVHVLGTLSILKTASLFGVIPLPVPNLEWVGALGQVLIWDFSFFDGPFAWVRLIVLVPIAIGIVVSIILGLVGLVSSH